MRTTVGRRLLVVAVGALVCAALSSCWPGPGAVPQEFRLSGPTEAFLWRVETLRSSVEGTAEERARAEERRRRARHQGYAGCMRSHGLPYTVPDHDVVPPPPRFYEPFWWTRPSFAEVRLGFGQAVPDTGPPELMRPADAASLPVGARPAYRAALEGCLRTVATDAPDVLAQLETARSLGTSMGDALQAATSGAGFASIRRQYATCMREEGIPVDDPGRLDDVVEQAVGRTKLSARDPGSVGFASAQAEARRAEFRIGDADVRCRAPLMDRVVPVLGPALQSWVETHAAQLDVVAAGWRTVGS